MLLFLNDYVNHVVHFLVTPLKTTVKDSLFWLSLFWKFFLDFTIGPVRFQSSVVHLYSSFFTLTQGSSLLSRPDTYTWNLSICISTIFGTLIYSVDSFLPPHPLSLGPVCGLLGGTSLRLISSSLGRFFSHSFLPTTVFYRCSTGTWKRVYSVVRRW